MAESRTLPRGRGLRSISAGMKPGCAIPTAQHHSSTTRGAEADEVGDVHEEVMTLQMLLRERTEQVERFQALLSERRLLQRHDEALGKRMRQYEEQLVQLGLAVRELIPTAKGEKGPAVDVADRGPSSPPISVREIMDGVYQLRYEKHRLEEALAKRERELDAVRAELQHAQGGDKVQELPLQTEVTGTNACCTTAPTQTAVEEEAGVSLEHQLAEVREKLSCAEKKITVYQGECSTMRQVIREREKEVLELQRQHREAVGTRSKQPVQVEEQQLFSSQWKNTKKLISSRHRSFFHGAEWLQILNEKPEAVRTAFLRDASLELCAPCGFISVVEMQAGSDFVAIEVEVRRPASLADDKVELILLQCRFTEMQRLLALRHEPKEGWDMVQAQLREAQSAMATKEREALELQERLQRVERLLAEHHDEREAEDRWMHEALDETEKTVMVMHKEVKEQREKEKRMEARLNSATELLEVREKEISELTVRLQTVTAEAERQEERAAERLDELRRRASTELRGVEEKRRQELSTLRQQHQQQLCKVAEIYRPVTHSLTLDCDPHAREAMALLNSKGSDILRALVLNEAAIAVNAIPRKVVSLTCTGNEFRAEVQLQVSTLALDEACVVESVRHFRAPTATLFLQQWVEAKELVEDRNREIQRLTQELAAMSAKAEELIARNAQLTSEAEVKLRKEREHPCDTEKRSTALAEEVSRIREALGMDDTSQSLPARVARLGTAVAEAEQSREEHEKKCRVERVRVQSSGQQLCGTENEKHQMYRRLAERLRESKQDLERATEALESLHGEHRQLLDRHASIQRLLDRQEQALIEVQATRQHKLQLQRKGENHDPSKRVAGDTETAVEERHDVVAALHSAYAEYDEVYETLESCTRKWRKTEKLQRDKLQEREKECNELRAQLAILQQELRRRQEEATTEASDCKHSEVERDELLNRIQSEMQALTGRLAKNDALQRETESAKRALEQQVARLQQQCDACEAERRQLQGASTILETDRAALEKKVGKLESEMQNRGQWAEEVMRRLVAEEDARRAAEKEVEALKRSYATTHKRTGSSGGGIEESTRAATVQEVNRLRNFCIQTLRLPLTVKEQTISDVVAFLEQHRGLVVEEQEKLAAALASMSEASVLLKQCMAATEGHKEGVMRRMPTSGTSGKESATGDLRAFGRSLTYTGVSGGAAARFGLPPTLASRKFATPTPLTRLESSHKHLQRQSVKKTAPSVALASTAAEVVSLSQLLAGVVAQWRDNAKQKVVGNIAVSKKCSDPSEASGRTQHVLPNAQQHQKGSRQRSDFENEVTTLNSNCSSDFLRRSRAHALCVALSVKDHLHDALATLQSVLHAFHKETHTLSGRFAADSIHDLRMSEGCVMYALKRISQSADAIFSPKERREIEARRGAEYFSVPVGWHDDDASAAYDQSPPFHTPKRQRQPGNTLVLRDVNVSTSPSRSCEKQESDGVRNGVAVAEYRQNLSPEDNKLIQWALLEARRRKR
ncbi:hypothetical protein TraAM80_08375 [Trypanosoma rangeli]|uniref:Flagellar attachment zone protein 1 conserved domain-containing protein n=1 Tax=Trypanosoma rangeli TaxID=5698 RepID=A0A422N1Q4_TRYRA|nr:uncharacterized protein TraAM80_08375 [Trypanosoma rangeli]RNE99373.1 hypothetical protein TraAM80_08375 [Trypanosoma rangeli]|eukprot:RNE99373.1 hypothetical protein TraAM80_08375 [Trypanosoma rangeli]